VDPEKRGAGFRVAVPETDEDPAVDQNGYPLSVVFDTEAVDLPNQYVILICVHDDPYNPLKTGQTGYALWVVLQIPQSLD
jgi:hypothetical protein